MVHAVLPAAKQSRKAHAPIRTGIDARPVQS